MSLDMHSRLATGAGAVAAGGLAGVAGTAVTLFASKLEKPLAELPPLKQASLWEYGAVWGVVRGVLGAAGVRSPAAAATLLAAVWSSDQLILPPPGAPSASWTWHRQEMAVDLVRCAVYATATNATFKWLKGRASHRFG
jgi:hypothetical protein